MALSRQEVVHLARLARIALSDEEIDLYRSQLDAILAHFAVLDEVETAAVPATASVLPLASVMREDEVVPSLDRDIALAGAPRQEGGFIRVRAVLD